MLKTIEAIYENGRFEGLENQLPRTRTRVLVTILGAEIKRASKKKPGMAVLAATAGAFKTFKGGTAVSKRMRKDSEKTNAGSIRASRIFGIWKNRKDIGDSVAFARSLRKKAEERNG